MDKRLVQFPFSLESTVVLTRLRNLNMAYFSWFSTWSWVLQLYYSKKGFFSLNVFCVFLSWIINYWKCECHFQVDCLNDRCEAKIILIYTNIRDQQKSCSKFINSDLVNLVVFKVTTKKKLKIVCYCFDFMMSLWQIVHNNNQQQLPKRFQTVLCITITVSLILFIINGQWHSQTLSLLSMQ